MRLVSKVLLAAIAAVGVASVSSAATVSATTSAAELAPNVKMGEGRLRWGTSSGFEVAAGANAGSGSLSSNVNYSGLWNASTTYTFSLGWNAATGTITMSTSRGTGVATYTIGTAAGTGPQNIVVRMQARAGHTITLTNLSVNGSAVSGSIPTFAPSGDIAAYYNIAGVGGTGFTSLTGSFTMAAPSNAAQERPVINFSLMNPSNSDLTAGPVPIPLPSAALAGGAALVAGMTRRVRRA